MSLAIGDRSLLEAAAGLARAPLRRYMLCVLAVVVAIAGYCVGHTLIVGGAVDPLVSSTWAIGVVVPWAGAWWLLGRIAPADRRAGMRVLAAAGLAGLAAVTSAALERSGALAFGIDDGSTFTELLFRKLPLLIGFVLGGEAYLSVVARRRAAAPLEPAIVVPSRGGAVTLLFDEIEWVQAAENYIELHAAGGSYLVRRTLASFAADPRAARFVRIHRSLLVHRDRVAGVERRGRGLIAVRMQDGRRLDVGRSFRAEVERVLG